MGRAEGRARERGIEVARGGGVSRVIEWLYQRHGEAVAEAMGRGFFAGLPAAARVALDRLPTGLADLVRINAHEWLLAEAVLRLGDGSRAAVPDLLHRPGAPLLVASVRQWIRALGRHRLSLFEVDACEPGDGLWCADLLQRGRPRLWLRERAGSRAVLPGQILGLRVVGTWGDLEASGAVYPFARRTDALALAGRLIRQRLSPGCDGCGLPLVRGWLDALLAGCDRSPPPPPCKPSPRRPPGWR